MVQDTGHASRDEAGPSLSGATSNKQHTHAAATAAEPSREGSSAGEDNDEADDDDEENACAFCRCVQPAASPRRVLLTSPPKEAPFKNVRLLRVHKLPSPRLSPPPPSYMQKHVAIACLLALLS
jgi:hypothetical protein